MPLNNKSAFSSRVLDLAKNVIEDTSVLEVSDLWIGIESANDAESFAGTGLDVNFLTDFEVSTLHIDVEGFFTCQTKCISIFAILELKGENTHTN